jgi:hypothetical protein
MVGTEEQADTKNVLAKRTINLKFESIEELYFMM